MHFSERDFLNEFMNKTHQNLMNNKICAYKKQKHPLGHRSKTGRVTIPQIITNFISVPWFIVFKIQKLWSSRIKVIAQKPLCLQMDNTRQ